MMRTCLCTLLLLAGSAGSFLFQTPGLSAFDRRPSAVVELGGLRSPVPADWAEEVPYNPECLKEYRLAPASDDEYYAAVTIYSLGKQPEGAAARQVRLWKRRFIPPEGKTAAEASRVQEFKLPSAVATYLDVRGDYRGIPGNVASRRQNFRQLGVYLDTPKGAYEISLFGPAATVESYRGAFERWIKAFK
jgi:hypothetical protein